MMTEISLWMRRRLAAFRSKHPEVDVHKGPFGEWHAALPLEDGPYDCGFLHHRDLSALLDELEDLLADTG